MLKQRILTAFVLAVVVLWAIFGLPDKLLLLFFGLILLGGAWEWTALAELHGGWLRMLVLAIHAGLMFVCWQLVMAGSGLVPAILGSAVLAWLLILYGLSLHERGRVKIYLSRRVRILLGLILLSVSFVSIAFIVIHIQNGRELILLLLFLIWGADIAAYFTGRTWGKTRLAPHISPGKSWQGVAGALLMSVLIAGLAWWLMNYPVDMLPKLIVLSLIVVMLSIVGDLFESLLKRQVGVKDSSKLLPGHGGVLDRIDSMIAAGPVYALGMYLLGVG